ncbi:tyrosine-type recombinase/integrase [Planctomycetota bacterium]
MAITTLTKNTRSAKFPLTLHPTGQYCKKIRGKLHYFGIDRQQALQRYLEQAAYLHAGRQPETGPIGKNITLKMLCNLYLDHQETRVTTGEIKPRQLHDQKFLMRRFARFIGPNRSITDISTMDLQNYRTKLVKAGKAASTVNNHISVFKALFNWALDKETITSVPNLKAIKKIPRRKNKTLVFTPDQIRRLLEHANNQMKAMIWLGLNCGFGCTDCAELLWDHLDLDTGRVNFSRTKTGVERNLPLWENTMFALKRIPRKNERVFNTSHGNKYVRIVQKINSDGTTRTIFYNSISKEFSKLLKIVGIETEKGTGFYTLKRTAATLAAQSGDPFVVQRLLGHADLKMATTYVQDVSEQTDKVINNSRKLICQDDF